MTGKQLKAALRALAAGPEQRRQYRWPGTPHHSALHGGSRDRDPGIGGDPGSPDGDRQGDPGGLAGAMPAPALKCCPAGGQALPPPLHGVVNLLRLTSFSNKLCCNGYAKAGACGMPAEGPI